jgi:hypothetical protein
MRNTRVAIRGPPLAIVDNSVWTIPLNGMIKISVFWFGRDHEIAAGWDRVPSTYQVEAA